MNTLDTTHLLALAAALGWASGIRLYAVVFLTGLAGYLQWVPLPPGLQLLAHPAVLGVSGFMLAVEFLADKIPWVDSSWDAVHTLVRIPVGAALAGAAIGADNATMTTVAALLGGTLAAASHTTKMTTRAAVNSSPEPFTNVAVSLLEDGLVVAALWLATEHPVAFAVALGCTLVLMGLLMIVLLRFLKGVVRRVLRLFGGPAAPAA